VNRAAAPSARHLILAQSSLQFILAAALAEETRSLGGRCRLLFLPDVLDPGLFAQGIDGWNSSPFESIQFITPRRRAGQAAKARDAGAVRRDIVAALVACAPTVVTVFNDRQDAGQTVLIETARQFPQALRRCAEDGALAYTDFRYRAHAAVTRWRQRLRLGRGWCDVQVLGTHPLVQRYLAMHPELLRAELRGHVVELLPSAQLGSASLQAFASRLCRLTAFDTQRVASAAVLLALGHASYAERNPDYGPLVRGAVEGLVGRGHAVFFKYHPRETAPDYLGLAGLPLAQEVPRTLPVECLYLLVRERPLVVAGGMSTSLLTAALLMPRARIAALVHASNTGDAWSPALLEALGIARLQDAASLAAYVDAQPG
jgi:hypothetical protein